MYGTDPLDPIDPIRPLMSTATASPTRWIRTPPLIRTATHDGDGLSNETEGECGTDPCVAEPDHDLDGIETATSLTLGHDPCDPASPDTDTDDDRDGIRTGPTEVLPTSDDMDGDGIPNTEEETCGRSLCCRGRHGWGWPDNMDELSLGTDLCDASSPDQDRDEDLRWNLPTTWTMRWSSIPAQTTMVTTSPTDTSLGVCNTDPCTLTPDPDGDGSQRDRGDLSDRPAIRHRRRRSMGRRGAPGTTVTGHQRERRHRCD